MTAALSSPGNAGEIEYLRQRRDVSPRRKVDTHQPQHRLIDDAEICLPRRFGSPIAPAEPPDRLDTFRTRAPSGKSIPRKKMSLQALCDRSIRTGAFPQEWETSHQPETAGAAPAGFAAAIRGVPDANIH